MTQVPKDLRDLHDEEITEKLDAISRFMIGFGILTVLTWIYILYRFFKWLYQSLT